MLPSRVFTVAEPWISTRSASASTCVKMAPTVGPSSTQMPPAIVANTMLSDRPSPAIMSGPMYIWYCAKIAPPSAHMPDESAVILSRSRVTLIPTEAAASSSWLAASSA